MSNFTRLLRVAQSWTGKLRRNVYYEVADARLILTELGLQMSPAALAWMTSTDAIMEDFLHCIYEAEEVLGKSLILEGGMEIDPAYQPKVYEDNGILIFTVTKGKKEVIFAEFLMPGAKKGQSGRIKNADFEVEVAEEKNAGAGEKPSTTGDKEFKITWE